MNAGDRVRLRDGALPWISSVYAPVLALLPPLTDEQRVRVAAFLDRRDCTCADWPDEQCWWNLTDEEQADDIRLALREEES
jgi:hypothetical protein